VKNRNRLGSVSCLVQEVNVMDSHDSAHLALLARPELGITFTKLHCWALTDFSKCVFLDADTLVNIISLAIHIQINQQTLNSRSFKIVMSCLKERSSQQQLMLDGLIASTRVSSSLDLRWKRTANFCLLLSLKEALTVFRLN
jgi:hypothetical protein